MPTGYEKEKLMENYEVDKDEGSESDEESAPEGIPLRYNYSEFTLN